MRPSTALLAALLTIVSSALMAQTLGPSPPAPNTPGSTTITSSVAVATSQATVTTAASLIVAARSGAQGVGRSAVTIYNAGATTVYLGATAGVTTANGMPLPAGAGASFNTMAALYGIAASGSNVIGVTETY